MKGELTVDSPSSSPAYVEGWLIQRKKEEFLKWLTSNFVPEYEHYDFSDWENDDELEDDQELVPETVTALLHEVWGHLIDLNELRVVSKQIEEETSKYWKPSENRVSVDEVEEDESLEELLHRLPQIKKHLELLENFFPGYLGHNRPPAEFGITAEEIQTAKSLVDQIQQRDRHQAVAFQSKLLQLARVCLKIGKACLKYFAGKADVLVDGFVETVGPEAGKWTSRGLAVYFAGEGVRSFGEALMRALN